MFSISHPQRTRGDVEIYNKSPLVGGYLILIGVKSKIVAI